MPRYRWSRRARERAVDQRHGVVEPVDRHERAEARAFLLAEQHLVKQIEPFERDAGLAVLGLDLAGAVEEGLASPDLVDDFLDPLRARVGGELRERVAQIEQRLALDRGGLAELLLRQHEIAEIMDRVGHERVELGM